MQGGQEDLLELEHSVRSVGRAALGRNGNLFPCNNSLTALVGFLA